MYFQTGDVLYFKTESIPKAAKPIKGNLIHQGNNHKHTISGKFKLYKTKDDMFIRCDGTCKLLHEEHKIISIPKGIYKKGIVMEYDHWLEESRQVID